MHKIAPVSGIVHVIIIFFITIILTGLIAYKFFSPKSNGQFCGGVANISCPVKYTCKLDGNYPDAGGKCVTWGWNTILTITPVPTKEILPTPTTSEPVPDGTLEVIINTGPTSPVCTTDKPCSKPYSNRSVNIYDIRNTLISTRTTDKNGKFTLFLPPGDYYLKSPENGRGTLQKTSLTITSKEVTRLNLEVDTSIR